MGDQKHRPGRAGRLQGRSLQDLLERIAPYAAPHALVHAIPPHQLQPNPRRPHPVLDPDDFAELIEDVRTHQEFGEPLLARSMGAERYELLAGHARWAAALEVGLPAVPALVVELEDDAADVVTLAAALMRENVTPWEEAQGLSELTERLSALDQPADEPGLAALTGRNRRRVRDYLRIGQRLTPHVLDLAGVSVHDMNVMPRAALVRAAEPADEAERARVLRDEAVRAHA